MNFIITIDTEADNQWDHGRSLTVENIKFIPRFQNLCERYEFTPTYLVTSEVCSDSFARELFSGYVDKKCAEIGAHLHPWTTPPFRDESGYRQNDSTHAYASELPYDLISEKIINLTDQITTSFGRKPTSFRSGRYGFNDVVAKVLIENSYLADSSVTPFVSWSKLSGIPGGNGGPDFLSYSPFPHTIENVDGKIVEMPITIIPTRFPFNINWQMTRSLLRIVNGNLLYRGLKRMHLFNQPVWARPFPGMTINKFHELFLESKRLGLPYLNMMFHSSELMPGCSRYRPDSKSIEELYLLLESIFKLLKKNQIGSLTLTKAAQAYILTRDMGVIKNISQG